VLMAAGAYSGLYESLYKMDAQEGNKGRPIFDIIAGTSIGAINAAVLVSYVVENQTYEGSAESLSILGIIFQRNQL
jgi:NTE family protein